MYLYNFRAEDETPAGCRISPFPYSVLRTIPLKEAENMVNPQSLVIIFMLVSGVISAFLAFVGWRNRAIPISRPFILLMAAVTVWSFGYAVELMSTSLPAVLLINDITYPAIQTVPVAWLFIVLCYTGRGQYLTRRTVPLFFIVPALVWILVLTNPLHNLYYTGFHPGVIGTSTFWIYEHGPLFWIHISYCYILALVALILAAGRLFVSTDLYKRQTILLVCAACIPALCNMAYVFRLFPFPEYDLTPVAFLAAGIILAVGILRYQLFSAVPVAYPLVFLTMRDGVIVSSADHRVIDLNPAAERICGFSSSEAIGRPLAEVIPGLTLPDNGPAVGGGRRFDLLIQQDGRPLYFDVSITPMDASGPGARATCASSGTYPSGNRRNWRLRKRIRRSIS